MTVPATMMMMIAIRLPLLFAYENFCDYYMGSNTEKKPLTNLQNSYKN